MNKDIIIHEFETDSKGFATPRNPSQEQEISEKIIPNQGYLCIYIPKPSSHRLATEEDKKGPKPQGYRFLEGSFEISEEIFYTGPDSEWVTSIIYLVPKKTEKEAKKESILKKIEELKSELEKL